MNLYFRNGCFYRKQVVNKRLLFSVESVSFTEYNWIREKTHTALLFTFLSLLFFKLYIVNDNLKKKERKKQLICILYNLKNEYLSFFKIRIYYFSLRMIKDVKKSLQLNFTIYNA